MGYPAAAGLPELREAIAGWVGRRFGVTLDPGHARDPDARVEGGDLLVRPGRARRRPPGATRSSSPSPAIRSPDAAPPSPERAWSELPLLEEHGFLPDLDAVPEELWRRTALFWLNSPNNPTGAVAPLAVPRAARRARARARLRARLRRGVHASSGSTSRRPRRSSWPTWTNVVGVQHALEALLDDRLPQRLRRRRPRADRRAQAVPPERRHGAAGVRPAGLGRRLGRRGARRPRTRGVRAEAGAAPRRPRPQGPARRRRARDDVPLDRGARRRDVGGPRRAPARAAASSSRPARTSAPSGEGYVRYALVPTEDECARAAAILEDVL